MSSGLTLSPGDTRALEKVAWWGEGGWSGPKPESLCACVPPSLLGQQNYPCGVIALSDIQHVKPLDQGLPHTHMLELLAVIPLQTEASLPPMAALENSDGLQLSLKE